MTKPAKLRACRCGGIPVWQPWLLGGKVDLYCPGCGKVFGSYDDNPICRTRAMREWNKHTKSGKKGTQT